MKKLLLLLVMMLLPMWAWANDFEVDGICYSITSIDNMTVEVSTNSNTETETSNYEGDVIIPPSVVYNNITFTVTGIGMAAFCYYEKRPGSETVGGNDKITSVSLPSCIEYISTNSFTGCTSLAKIELPENLTSIGIEAFSCCTNLQEVLLGDKVERLAQGCFSNCTSLTKITIPKRVHEIGIEVFSGCNNLIEVNIPYGVTVLRDEVLEAFQFCAS